MWWKGSVKCEVGSVKCDKALTIGRLGRVFSLHTSNYYALSNMALNVALGRMAAVIFSVSGR